MRLEIDDRTFAETNYDYLRWNFDDYLGGVQYRQENCMRLLIEFLSKYSKDTWDHTCIARVDNIIKDSLYALIPELEDLCVELTSDMEQKGFNVARQFLISFGFVEMPAFHTKEALRPILENSWANVINAIYKNINIKDIKNGTPWLMVVSLIADQLRGSFLQNEWRATRIIRTEVSHAFHSGILEAILMAPGASKALVNPEGQILQIKKPLEQFEVNGDEFWAPPGHPNSYLSMVAINN